MAHIKLAEMWAFFMPTIANDALFSGPVNEATLAIKNYFCFFSSQESL
jgi:hypothetical protein